MFVIAATLLWYFGSLISVAILSENIPELKKGKNFSSAVPILTVVCFYWILSCEDKPFKERIRHLFQYIKAPHKYLLILCALVEAYQEYQNRYPQKSKVQARKEARRNVAYHPQKYILAFS